MGKSLTSAAAQTIALAGFLAGVCAVADDGPDAGAERFFESEVRPLFAAKCQKCHGPRQQKGGLRLDSRLAVLKGGETGPAVVPGNVEESLLIEAVNYESLEMPPDGPLASREVRHPCRLGEAGRTLARAEGGGRHRSARNDQRRRSRVLGVSATGEPHGARRRRRWLVAEPHRSVRRRQAGSGRAATGPRGRSACLDPGAAYDLTGLPPAWEEVEAFRVNPSPRAYETMLDRLLASPRYGERWGRHWLDLARYAESDGHGADRYRPEAWRYRDYVIRAFNDDKPYDRFILEQLAGDEVAPGDFEALTATGFLRHWIYENNQREIREVREIILTDVTDVTADVFLGLGFGCARCHDHKFDPILQEDYYRLQAFFAPMLPRDDIITTSAAEQEQFAGRLQRWQEATAELRQEIETLEKPVRQFLQDREIRLLPQDLKAVYRKPVAERSPLEQQLVALIDRLRDGAGRGLDGQFKLMPEKEERWKALRERLAEYDDRKPAPLPAPMVVTDVGPLAPPTMLPGRDKVVEPGFPSVLASESSSPRIASPESAPGSTGRRTALARWIASPENPLTARVIVNRVWQQHFGVGLVATASDFGRLGERPSHPELLDWLASRLIADGWRLKPLHRLIMTSATYRQSALHPGSEAARRNDPNNRWLWRMGLRRLDADQIRDTVLSVSGELDASQGGPSVDATAPRRTVYTKLVRYSPEPLLQAFDAPDGFVSTPQRDTTTTATQALQLLNGPWALGRAEKLARRLATESATTPRWSSRPIAWRWVVPPMRSKPGRPLASSMSSRSGSMPRGGRRQAGPQAIRP